MLLLRAALAIFISLGLSQSAGALEVGAAFRQSVDAGLDWCATRPDVSLDDIFRGACAPVPAKPNDLARGFDQRAFWLRLTLTNINSAPIERWLTVGHPRLEEVSLFVQKPGGGWERSNMGIRIPLALRPEQAQSYGVLPMVLPSKVPQTVWLRVVSRTVIDLSTTLWEPTAYRAYANRTQFSLSMSIGSLLFAMVLAGALFALTHEKTYLFFAIAMAGEAIVESFRSGVFQQYAWPTTAPLWIELASVGTILAFTGFVACFYFLIPSARSYRRTFCTFTALVIATLTGQFWAIGVDYSAGTRFSLVTLYATLVIALWLAFKAWRGGSSLAGIFLLSFVFTGFLESLRVCSTLGLLPFFSMETRLAPWVFLTTTPLILLSIFQRTRELEANLLRAEATSRAKVDFLAQMSHELRTPINTVLGNAQLLARPGGLATWPGGLASIMQSGRHLLAMIEEILDYARAQAGRLEIEPEAVDWSVFMNQTAQNARVLASANSNEFTMDVRGAPLAGVLLDEGRLRQVLDNLLANAARHTHAGQIRLECDVGLPDKTGRIQIDFALTDTGEGIALPDQARVFLPFVRSEVGRLPKRRSESGGMGLAISKQLVETMGGQLTLESGHAKGTCMRFWLPVFETTQPQPAQLLPTYTGYAGPKRTILVVEDKVDDGKLLQCLLRDCGFFVLLASSGKEATDLLRSVATSPNAVDLVLTDQFMANGDGWSVLELVSKRWPDLPVLLMSAARPDRPASVAPHLEFSAHFLKPLEHGYLLRCIGEQLGLEWTLPEAGLDGKAITAAPVGWTLGNSPENEISLERLRQMIHAGQMTDIMDWARALKARDAGAADFAMQVSAAARTLDIALLSMLARQNK